MRLTQAGFVFGIALLVVVASTAAPVTAAFGSGSSDVLPQQGGVTDTDRDGIPDAVEGTGDPDNDGTPNHLDDDSDDDGILDAVEHGWDTNGDGISDFLSLDSDGDGIPDADELEGDIDLDGRLNYRDLDSDGDSVPDAVEGVEVNDADPVRTYRNSDDDAIEDFLDDDDDGDGIPTATERMRLWPLDGRADERTFDRDGDGVPNHLDDDADGDGIYDGFGATWNLDTRAQSPALEGLEDLDSDGKPDFLDPDSDGDGIRDTTEGVADPDRDGLANFRDTDSDGDGLTDKAEVAGDTDPYVPEPDPNRDLWLDGVPGGPGSSTDTIDQVGLDPDTRMGEVLDWIERSGGVNVPGGLFASERVDVRLVADDGTTELARGFVVTKDGRVISADHGDGRNPTMRVYVTEGAATRLVDSPARPRTLQDELDAGTIRYEGVGIVGGLKVTFAKFVYTVWRFIRGFSLRIRPPLIAPSG